MTVNNFGNRLAIREDKNGQAWHKLGGFSGEKSAILAMESFSDGIPVFKKEPTFFLSEENEYEQTGDFAIIRLPVKDDNYTRVIGYCTKGYHVVQAEDIGKAFDEKVGKPIETIGFLGKGERMFLTWEMPKSIMVGGKDEVKLFGTVLAGFDAKVAISLSLLSWRVVCENTFNMANNFNRANKRGKKNNLGESSVWVGRHNSPNILRDLSAWMGHVQNESEAQMGLAENLFNKLQATPVDSAKVLRSLIEQIYPTPAELGSYPAELRAKKEEELSKKFEKAIEDQRQIEYLFGGGDKTTSGATAWDLFNNVSFYENHLRESKKDTSNSIMFGNRSTQMNYAMAVLNDFSNDK